MGGLPDATGVLCNPVTAKVTKPRFSGFPGGGKGLTPLSPCYSMYAHIGLKFSLSSA